MCVRLMDYNGNELLDEILSSNSPLGMNDDLFNYSWSNFDNSLFTPPPPQTSLSLPLFNHHIQTLNSYEFYHPFGDHELTETPSFLAPEEEPSLSLIDDASFVMSNYQTENGLQNVDQVGPCKMEPQLPGPDMARDKVCLDMERKGRVKKVDGQPSKNLMAERRRRKRLNERLSMLRSVVPKISKMDRTSILGDTIDYMKELLDKISSMQEEMEVDTSNQLNIIKTLKNVKASEVLVRNSPKFNVERKNVDNRVEIEICCAGKPGLLLSTLTTLEALGIEIQHSVISCFSDFSLQASCSQLLQKTAIASTEDIKQEIYRNAGYGGRCL